MLKANHFSRKQLFNIARTVSNTSLLNFSKSINVTSPLVLSCLNGTWHNKKIDDAIDEFIGINISSFVSWALADKSNISIQKKRYKAVGHTL